MRRSAAKVGMLGPLSDLKEKADVSPIVASTIENKFFTRWLISAVRTSCYFTASCNRSAANLAAWQARYP